MGEETLRDVFGTFLVDNADQLSDLVVLDADLSSSTRTSKFAAKYPERFFNMGVAEQSMLGTAIGFAISGKLPIVSGFSIFTTGRAWEFIRLACHDKLNIKIITTHGGFVGKDGSTHNSLEDLSLMATLPNLTILIPADNAELLKMLQFAVNTEGPMYIRLPRGSYPKIHDNSYNFSLKKPDVVKNGADICIIGVGYGTALAVQSVQKIEKKLGISIKIINLSCIKPIDEESLLNELNDMSGIIVIEEHNIYCGVGSIIARIISKTDPKPMRFIGVDESFGQSGTRKEVLNYYGLNSENLLLKIKSLLKK